jgi:hypothetical protein
VRRAGLALALVLLAGAGPARADGGFSWRGHPKAECSTFLITETGVLIGLTSVSSAGSYPVFTVPGTMPHMELGAMTNIGAQDAVGASALFETTTDGVRGGARLRYRRWLNASLGLDIAPGLTILGDNGTENYPSFSGRVGFSFADRAGITFDLETFRPDPGPPQTRLYMGIHFGAQAGAILMPVVGVLGVYRAMLEND